MKSFRSRESLKKKAKWLLPALAILPLFSVGCARENTKGREDRIEPVPENLNEGLGSQAGQTLQGKGWIPVPGVPGVGFLQKLPSIHQVNVVFGGHKASSNAVRGWASALYQGFFSGHGKNAMVAVQGPRDVDYGGREIKNSVLAEFIGNLPNLERVVLIAHSSGIYPALELLEYLTKGRRQFPISLFNLDGIALPQQYATNLKAYFPVYAFTGDQTSTWAHIMKRENTRISLAKPIGVQVRQEACYKDSAWCMHVALVNKRPHNPRSFDLEKDYRDFSPPRGIETQYLQKVCTSAGCG